MMAKTRVPNNTHTTDKTEKCTDTEVMSKPVPNQKTRKDFSYPPVTVERNFQKQSGENGHLLAQKEDHTIILETSFSERDANETFMKGRVPSDTAIQEPPLSCTPNITTYNGTSKSRIDHIDENSLGTPNTVLAWTSPFQTTPFRDANFEDTLSSVQGHTTPIEDIRKTIVFEGFPETPRSSHPEEKPEKLKFSEIPRRSKLTLMVMAVANFGAGCAFSLPAPFFPREATQKGASLTMIGIVFSIFEFVNFIMTPVFGNFVSEIGPKFMYASGIVVAGSCSVLFGFLDQGPNGVSFIIMSLVVRIVEAVGMSAFQTSSFAIISAEFPNHISSVFSVLEVFIGMGLLIGPTIGGTLYELGGFGLPFWVTGILIMASGLLFFGCLPPPKRPPNKRQGNILSLLRSPLVWVAMFLVTSGAMALGFLDPSLALHLDQFDLSTIEVSLFFIIAPLLHALLAPLLGYLSDTKDIQSPMLVWASIACGSGFLMIGPTPLLPFLPRQIWLITVGLVTFGLGIGCTIIPTMKCIVMGARELGFEDSISTFGMVSGLFNANFHFGAFFGPTISGALVENIGFEYSATVIAGVFVVALCVTSSFFGYRRWRQQRGDHSYVSLINSKQHGGGINYYDSGDSIRRNQNTLTVSERSVLLESKRKTSVSCQTPPGGRFLQSSTFSSSGHMSW